MEDFEIRTSKLEKAIPKFAKAKAERVYIEQFRKSKKAILMRSAGAAGFKTQSEREQYAYAHPDYVELIEGLKNAVEIEEKCKWALEKFKVEFEYWRTTQANERYLKDRI